MRMRYPVVAVAAAAAVMSGYARFHDPGVGPFWHLDVLFLVSSAVALAVMVHVLAVALREGTEGLEDR